MEVPYGAKGYLAAIGEQGLPFFELVGAVRREMATEDLENMGSLGWHATMVKLNMEALGELKTVAAKGPQRLILTQFPFSFGKLTPYRTYEPKEFSL